MQKTPSGGRTGLRISWTCRGRFRPYPARIKRLSPTRVRSLPAPVIKEAKGMMTRDSIDLVRDGQSFLFRTGATPARYLRDPAKKPRCRRSDNGAEGRKQRV